MKILLTGGGGFIGRSLGEALGKDNAVVAPHRLDLNVLEDGAVERAVREERPDVLFHCAVGGGERVLDHILRGFWNVARVADRVGRIVYFGSGAEYGKHRDLHKVPEEQVGAVLPRDDYGLGKLWCNELARRSRNIVNVRLFGLYGKHENYLFKFISNAVVKALLGERLVIRQDVVFDYLYIDDLMVIARALLDRECPFPDVNATPSHSIRLSEIIEILGAVTGASLPAAYENPGLNFEYTGSNQRLRDFLPGLAFTSYRQGVEGLYAFYRDRLPHLDRAAVARDEYRHGCRSRAAAPQAS